MVGNWDLSVGGSCEFVIHMENLQVLILNIFDIQIYVFSVHPVDSDSFYRSVALGAMSSPSSASDSG